MTSQLVPAIRNANSFSPKLEVHIESGQNPYKFKLPTNVIWDDLYLESYTFKGVPVTGGVPDYTHYNLNIPEVETGTTFVKTSGIPGIPLPLKKSYTQYYFQQPIPFVTGRTGSKASFTFDIRTHEGDLATFTEALFIFVFKVRS